MLNVPMSHVGTAAAIVLLLGACSGANTSEPSAASVQPSPVVATVDAEFSENEWGTEVRVALADLQEARARAADDFESTWRGGAEELDVQRALYEADAEALADFLEALPLRPSVDPLGEHFDLFELRTGEVLTDVERINGAFDQRETELRSLLESSDDSTSLGHPAIAEIVGDHAGLLDAWRVSCFDLQAALSETVSEPIDCVGVERVDDDRNPETVDPSLFDVSLTCFRGETLEELPYDRSVYPWQTGLAPDTPWIRSLVTIVNSSDRSIQVQSDFRVRYDDIDGNKILEANWTEPTDAAFHLQPGQTIFRTGYAFDGLTFARPIRGSEVSAGSIADVFSLLETCSIVEEPEAVVADPEPFIDQDWSARVDLVDCARNPETGHYEGTARIRNPTDGPVRVFPIGFEILNASGDRLGMGGSDGTVTIEPDSSTEVYLWSVLYTIAEADDARTCRLVELKIEE